MPQMSTPRRCDWFGIINLLIAFRPKEFQVSKCVFLHCFQGLRCPSSHLGFSMYLPAVDQCTHAEIGAEGAGNRFKVGDTVCMQATRYLQSKWKTQQECHQLEESLMLAMEGIPLHPFTAFELHAFQRLHTLGSADLLNSQSDTTCLMQQITKEYEGLSDDVCKDLLIDSQKLFRQDVLAAHDRVCKVYFPAMDVGHTVTVTAFCLAC
jgi:hypothetical protein